MNTENLDHNILIKNSIRNFSLNTPGIRGRVTEEGESFIDADIFTSKSTSVRISFDNMKDQASYPLIGISHNSNLTEMEFITVDGNKSKDELLLELLALEIRTASGCKHANQPGSFSTPHIIEDILTLCLFLCKFCCLRNLISINNNSINLNVGDKPIIDLLNDTRRG